MARIFKSPRIINTETAFQWRRLGCGPGLDVTRVTTQIGLKPNIQSVPGFRICISGDEDDPYAEVELTEDEARELANFINDVYAAD